MRLRQGRVFGVVRNVVLLVSLILGAFSANVSPAQAAGITFVQSAGANNNGYAANISAAFPSANTAGNVIVASISFDSGNGLTWSCSDTQGNIYSQATFLNDTRHNQTLGICYATNIKAGANTVTVTYGGKSQAWRSITAQEYSGVATVAPLDKVAIRSMSANTSANNVTSGTVTPTMDGELIFGAAIDDSGTATITAGTNFTRRQFVGTAFASEDRVQATAGAVAATFTSSASRDYIAAVATFKPASGTQDVTPPVISSVASNAVTTTGATITWTTDEPATSQVEYGLTTSYGQLTTLDTTLSTAHSVTVSGLNPNTLYNFRVRSKDAAGNEGLGSNATFTTLSGSDTQAPTTPTNLAVAGVNSFQVNLVWTPSTDNVGVTGYKINRNGSQVGTSTGPSFTDTGLTPNTTYAFAVSAFDAAGNTSALSASVSTTTLAQDAVAPTVVLTAPAASSTVSNTVTVSATASDNIGVVGVQFSLDGANLGAEDTSAPYSISWDTTTSANGTHTLAARARDAAGNTATSTVTVTVSNTQTSPTGLVAAYAFNEGSGTVTSDASGNGNTGTFGNGVTWSLGRYGNASNFNGSGKITVPDAASLHLSTAMTLEAWINPTQIANNWTDAVYKGNDNYFIFAATNNSSRPAGGGIFGGGSNTTQAYGAGALSTGTWTHLATTYDGANIKLYVNGALVSTVARTGAIAVSSNPLTIGGDAIYGQYFNGLIDEVRVYNRALSQAEIQTDMNTPIGSGNSSDPTPPTVHIDSPANSSQVSDIITVTADAADNVGVAGVQFLVDGTAVGVEDATDPYAVNWDTRTVANGMHTITAIARDTAGNVTTSAPITVNVANTNFFQNEVLATGFDLPTAIRFLPDGRLLVVELAGKIKVLPPPYTTPDPTPFLTLTNVGSAGVQQGIYDIALDPNFTTNHYYYIFYTAGSPNHDRLSRFTANATLTGTVPGSEFILYEDPNNANAEHHGGAVTFGNDGKIYFTTGEHFNGPDAQNLSSPRGKLHRINADGTVPTDNPFYDGAGPHVDSIYALGLRNPYRAYFDLPTNRLYIGDVGGNNYSTAEEEVDLGAAGVNYGWPNCELGTCGAGYTPALYAYPHNGRDASITGGFVYHGTQYPSAYQGSYFFADYTQNWIKRLTFDASGAVNGVFNFEPLDGSVDGPYGDIVYLTEGPDGALYYVDLGYSDISGQFGVSKIRRIRFISSNLPPTAIASANPTSGPAPLTVNFSSASSTDPENAPLSFSWTFGDGATSTVANPIHTYATSGQYSVRLSTSDGVNTTLGTPFTISVGNAPVPTITSPIASSTFVAGDVISYSGDATDTEDGTLPASAFTWNIDFLHEGHVHPGIPVTDVKSGTFTIPTSGHDFSGFTRYRITLTVTDSNGLTTSTSTVIFPSKVNITLDSVPQGLTITLDGLPHVTPFVYDTLTNFVHTITAANQSTSTVSYNFSSWSDNGAQTHDIIVPASAQIYTALFDVATNTTPITIGETNVAPINDSGNGNLLLAQVATLTQPATLQSLSFYVRTTGGNLRLGLYDATGPNGGPGQKLAEAAEFTPVVGWNTATVTPVALPAGSYWLAYLPQSNALGFQNESVGQRVLVPFTYGAMPSTFPTGTTPGNDQWSFYASLLP